MNGEEFVKIYDRLGSMSADIKNCNERLDRMVDLLTPRIEKWDDTSTKVGILMEESRSTLSPKKVSWVSVVVATAVGIWEAIKK